MAALSATPAIRFLRELRQRWPGGLLVAVAPAELVRLLHAVPVDAAR